MRISGALAKAVAALAVAVAATALSGCGQAEYRYESNRALGTFFKVPSAWQLQDRTGIDADGRPVEAPSGLNTVWHVVFSGEDGNQPDAFERPTSVIGSVEVLDVSDFYRNSFSLSQLRAAFFLSNVDPVYPPADDPSDRDLRLVDYQQLSHGDAVTGTRAVANIDRDPSPDAEAWVTQDVTVLFDNRAGRVWVLNMLCESQCYLDNQRKINELATSFTVRP